MINWLDTTPYDAWHALSSGALSSRDKQGLFASRLTLTQYWLQEASKIELVVVFFSDDVAVRLVIVPDSRLQWVLSTLSGTMSAPEIFNRLVVDTGAAIISPIIAQKLQPVFIPKPWGQEIWYSGIEARGVAGITDGSGVTPLPWLLAAFPELYGHAAPILLKILDPYADELLGDLYFELHQEKREVYVVTSINPRAWPTGQGAIRFGFNQQLRKTFLDDKAFVMAYFEAVKAYEILRRQIDALLDDYRLEANISLTETVSPGQIHEWLNRVPSELRDQEQSARAFMNNFTYLMPLNLGDIVKVPRLLPHSLQHGVRTVEFQTPVYERMILSFGQKVLTQSGWDTEAALPFMSIEPPENLPPVILASGQGWQCEQVVEFDDFAVERWCVKPGVAIHLPQSGFYSILMVVSGEITLDKCKIIQEEAVLLPVNEKPRMLVNNSPTSWIFLLAKPK